jgi:excisionase family DNA binding protein
MFDNYDEILTLEQLMEVLCIGRNTAYTLLNSGQIKGFKLGNKWRIPKVNLGKYIINKCGNY